MKSEIYLELESHLGDVLYSSWYGRSKAEGIGIDCNETQFRPGNKVITTEIIPSDYDRYEKDGIKIDDIIAVWIDNDRFCPISFRQYDDMYNGVVDATEGECVENAMYEALTSYLKQRMEACGVA